ncbi:unnamed protein product [Phytophthora fragariaefolia]|uniref:Unnamed protein product n=1 Tax=Phytophthora fragariaefolia TaxID=1490495 RepID=A0A9W6XYP2_9STRA|nr:unnamed protein product [Phytophthora fragariaefolia]
MVRLQDKPKPLIITISEQPDPDNPRIKSTSHSDKRSRDAGDTQKASSALANDCSSTTEAGIASFGRGQPEIERRSFERKWDLAGPQPTVDIEQARVSEPGESSVAQEAKLKGILKYHQTIFLGDGNAASPPTRGVVCDLDVGDAKPVAQHPRSIAPHLMVKVYELLKKLLETGLIEHSESHWASPIVIVLKKNGIDIRICNGYRVVNSFIQRSSYPLPMIDDLLIGFEGAMWFMSLDMASVFEQSE